MIMNAGYILKKKLSFECRNFYRLLKTGAKTEGGEGKLFDAFSFSVSK